LVEQWTENPRVAGSIPAPAISDSASATYHRKQFKSHNEIGQKS